VVIGDALLDVDVETTATRLVPDTPAPVLAEHSRRARPGGAGLAALLTAQLSGRQVLLVTGVPDDEAGARLADLLPSAVTLVPMRCSGRTPVKTRLRAGGQTVARLDAGSSVLDYDGMPKEACAAVRDAAAVLVADYGGGITAHAPVRDVLTEQAGTSPLVWDPHPRGAAPVPGARLVTPNAREAATLSGVPGDRLGDRRRQAETLRERWQAAAVAITLGGSGALLTYGDGVAELFPTAAQAGRDANGAGDCFAAAALMTLSETGLASEAVAAATETASRYVAADGNLAAVAEDGTAASSTATADVVAAVRRRGGTVVATGGCFDLLHAGHVATLTAARSLGDCLVVCVNSDDSVRRLKGPDRPLQSAADRVRVLSALAAVDAVLVFDEETPAAVLSTLRPDVWVKGGDYSAAALPEAELVRSWGGEVVTVPYLTGRSTSRLVELVRG
jgi:rfaE bifunctional protein nucleotidyltransferase chain/domain